MQVLNTIDRRIAGQRLLDHPFYQRWTAGELTMGELRDYARNYFHYAMAFPTFISAMHAHTDDIAIRQMLLENLIEEERGIENHPELWLRFCEAIGLSREEVLTGRANEATRSLIGCLRSLARDGELHEGLAGLYAYESQIPEVAKAKIAGLAQWYGVSDPREVSFFSVHETADVVHSEVSRSLLSSLCDSEQKCEAAVGAVSRVTNALYSFLDSVTVN